MKNYIIPLFGYNQSIEEKTFIGNAFLVQPNLLITAGHNIVGEFGKDFKHFAIIFEGNTIALGEFQYIEYSNGKLNELNNIEDLAIWNVKGIIDLASLQNTFQLCRIGVDVLSNYIIYPYDIDTAMGLKELSQYSVSIKDANASFTEKDKQPYIKISNCFEIHGEICSGYSGSPLIRNNIVYGMVINSVKKDYKNGSTALWGRLLKSSYIAERVNTLNF